MDEKIEKFLSELKELMDKHGIYIQDYSCGCCGYTFLRDKDGKELLNINDNFGDNKLTDLIG